MLKKGKKTQQLWSTDKYLGSSPNHAPCLPGHPHPWTSLAAAHVRPWASGGPWACEVTLPVPQTGSCSKQRWPRCVPQNEAKASRWPIWFEACIYSNLLKSSSLWPVTPYPFLWEPERSKWKRKKCSQWLMHQRPTLPENFLFFFFWWELGGGRGQRRVHSRPHCSIFLPLFLQLWHLHFLPEGFL